MSSDQSNPFNYLIENFKEFGRQVIKPGTHDGETECIEMIVPIIHKYGKQNIDAYQIDHEKKVPPEVYNWAKESGLFGLSIDTEYGGSGLSLKATSKIISELGSIEAGFATTVGLHNGLGVRGLNRFGSGLLKKKYLSQIASGQLICAFGASEPQAGSHISNIQTKAVFNEEKGKFVINGSKIYITNAHIAGLFNVFAANPQFKNYKKGHTLLLLPRETAGFSLGKEEDKVGIRASSTAGLFFEDVEVPYENVIGEPGKALEYFSEILTWGRTLMSAGCYGGASRALEKAVEHTRTRVQFHRPLAKFDLTREKISKMVQNLFIMRCLIDTVGQLSEQNQNIFFSSEIAKIFCSEAATYIADESVQLHGGLGIIEEAGVIKIARDLRVTRIFEGTNEMLRLSIAMQILSWENNLNEFHKTIEGCDPELTPLIKEFQLGSDEFLSVISFLRKKYRMALMNKQIPLKCIANSAISLFVVLSVLAYVNGLLGDSIPPEDKGHYLNLAKEIMSDHKKIINRIKDDVDGWDKGKFKEIAEWEYEHVTS